jgi:hypothetical protein
MPQWDLSPGNEHPITPIRKGPRMASRKALTAPEIKSRLDGLGAKTRDMSSGSFLVYPRDQAVDRAPIRVPGRIRGGTELPNIISQLRRSGWDLYPDAASPKAERPAPPPHPSHEKDDTAMSTPAVMPKQRAAVSLPPPLKLPTVPTNDEIEEKLDTLFGLLAEVEKRLPAEGTLSELRSRVTALETKQAADVREIRSLRKDLTAAEKRISELEAGLPAASTEKPISRAEQTRRDVQAFFESLPRGIRMSPENVRKNLGYPKETEDGRLSTRIPNACAELVKAGVLQGGGKRTEKDHPDFGMYWLPEEPTKDEQ